MPKDRENCKIVAVLSQCIEGSGIHLPTFENRLKRFLEIQKLPNEAIIIIMAGFFLGFGVFSNFIDGESLMYNLFQGVFMSLFTGGVLYAVMILIRRRKRRA